MILKDTDTPGQGQAPPALLPTLVSNLLQPRESLLVPPSAAWLGFHHLCGSPSHHLGWRCFPSRFDAFEGALLPHGGSDPGTASLLGDVRSTDPFESAGSPLLDVLWVKGNSLEQPE